jgi:hypothetical protein
MVSVLKLPRINYSCELESRLWRGVLDITLCDKNLSVSCDRAVVFPGTPVSSINKIDRHDIAEILLKVALNTTTITPCPYSNHHFHIVLSILFQLFWLFV